ncbi:hypothetical protein [Paracoccus siganidrum]|uniref:hypothetical protein n=1 Tax=Paracoccus siganidrum TaxID=1276757 RepID=UPI001604FC1B|nr:hypothetical protein [Paracoccus siganidrum]
MSDISASERRLSAALDRIDQILEAGRGHRPAPAEAAEDGARLADLQARLDAANDQLAGLARANEELAAANRALIDAAPDLDGDGVHRALEAEIGALRAARAAEIAQLGEIMAELEHYMGTGHPGPAAEAVQPEVMGDEAGLPEDGADQVKEEGR